MHVFCTRQVVKFDFTVFFSKFVFKAVDLDKAEVVILSIKYMEGMPLLHSDKWRGQELTTPPPHVAITNVT